MVSNEVSMDVDPKRLPKRKEPLNLLTGVFLKSVFFVESELIKCAILGIFKNRGDSLGIVFKGKRGGVFWSFDTFNQFAPHFNEITLATENNIKYYKKSDTGPEDVKVVSIFGKRYVFLFDGEHSLTLNSAEWAQFVNNLPLIHREFREMFMIENLVREYIRNVICSEEGDEVPLPEGISRHLVDKLFDEILLYKRWPNGGRG